MSVPLRLQKLAYRFALVYFALYCLPFPLYIVPGLGALATWYTNGSRALGQWFGENVLRIPADAIINQPTGSGDTLYNYVFAVAVLAVAIVVTLVWSIVDRLRTGAMAERWLPSYIRYALASIFLQYGFSKLPPLQFPSPGPELMIRTYGESSPMGLLWTFMGFSPAYQMFAGVAEIIPGLLLFFRRTATLGALIGAATMTNVVALNLCYDVPVKLFSLHLVGAALLLAAPDLPRLFDLLVRHRPVAAAPLPWTPSSPQAQAALMAVRALLIIAVLMNVTTQAYRGWYRYGGGAPRSPMAGVYDVTSFEADGESQPPLWTDTRRWRRFVVFGQRPWVTIQYMGGEDVRFMFEHDPTSNKLVLRHPGADGTQSLSFTETGEGRRVVEGDFEGRRIWVELEKSNAKFPLTSRGFRWIQELPYNR